MEEAALSIQDNIARCKQDKQQTLEGIVDTEKQVGRCGRCCGNPCCQQQDPPSLDGVHKSSHPRALVSWQIWGPWDPTGVTIRLAQRPHPTTLLVFTWIVSGPAYWRTVVAWRLLLAPAAGAGRQVCCMVLFAASWGPLPGLYDCFTDFTCSVGGMQPGVMQIELWCESLQHEPLAKQFKLPSCRSCH